jgi:hypothetical protein
VALRFPRLAGPVVAIALAVVEITAAGCSHPELTASTAARQSAGGAEAGVGDGGARIPGNLEECFTELRRVLPNATIEQMQRGSEGDLARYHLGLGMWMRNLLTATSERCVVCRKEKS